LASSAQLIPQKRMVSPAPDSDVETAVTVGRPKKRLSTMGPKIVDSDDSEDGQSSDARVRPTTPLKLTLRPAHHLVKPVIRSAATKKKPVVSDSDAFSASASEADQDSDNYFDGGST